MVEDDIKDHVQSGLVGGLYQFDQFVISGAAIVGKTRLGPQKIMDAVTVVNFMGLEVLQHGAKPDGAGPQGFDVAKLVLDARELSALTVKTFRIIERLMKGGNVSDC